MEDGSQQEFAVSYRDVFEASKLIPGVILRTPTLPAPKLSALTGADVYVKYENLQVTASFKDRGALVKLLSLSAEERRQGVIAMSAGNHAQAVAYHAQRLGVPATIVMPERTPIIKVANTEGYGARVVLAGETLAESRETAVRISEAEQLVLVHPYDDARVIAGQGTLALEMLADEPELDCVVIPIGGGGMIAGCAIALKQLKPSIEIFGVESAHYPSMSAAVRGDAAVCGGQTLAEGIAVKAPGLLCIPIVKALVSDIILVDETAIERAISAFLGLQKTMAEGAGAAGLAALLTQPERFAGRKVGLVLCGGNIDSRVLASIMIRDLERQDKIISLRLVIDDKPGMLGAIAVQLGASGANILEVMHRRTLLNVPAKGAILDVVVEVKNADHAREVMNALEAAGHPVMRIDA
ncbi:MAG: threonine ammonia-lyase [Hyphomicrobiales bacterium]|nr:threonine ammonia-lyase [Hyphomicrobiales bacterium]